MAPSDQTGAPFIIMLLFLCVVFHGGWAFAVYEVIKWIKARNLKEEQP